MKVRFLVGLAATGALILALAWLAAGGPRKVLTSHYPSGLGLSARGFVDGVPDGAWITWHPDRSIASESFYRRGQRNGRWATWSRADVELRRAQALLFERHYQDDLLHGPFVRRWLDGTTMLEGRYDRGRRVGPWQRFAEDGSLLESRDYGDGG
jgi:antitoxin component YwqK of YwqJK toxin-antitoxin module